MVLCVGRALLELVGDSIVCELVAADGAAKRFGYALEACGDRCRADEEHGGGDEARLHLCLCVCVRWVNWISRGAEFFKVDENNQMRERERERERWKI